MPYYEIFDAMVLEDGFIFLGYGDLAIMKTDQAGNFLWGKHTNFDIGYDLVRPKIKKANDEGFVFQGLEGVMKTDSVGNLDWSAVLVLYPTDIFACNDSGYMVIGNGPLFFFFFKENSYPQIGIIKTDAEGNGTECITFQNFPTSDVYFSLSPVDMVVAPIEITTTTPELATSDINITVETGCVPFIPGAVEEPQKEAIQIEVFPNPCNGIFHIKVSMDDATQFTYLEIYNLMGHIVFKSEDPAILENGVDLSAVSDGIYYINDVFGDKKASARIVIQR